MNRSVVNKIQYVKLKNIKSHQGNIDGKNDLLGLLEKPNIPLSVDEYKYRIFVGGGAGVGKSFLISWMTGLPPSHLYLPTPGIQTAISHYPAVLRCSAPKEVLFTIQFWEAGASSKIIHSGIFKDCPDGIDAVMLLFSCTDRKSFELLPKIITDISNHNMVKSPCFFVISVGCSRQEQSAVLYEDIIQFEKQWKMPVLIIPFLSAELDPISVTGIKDILVSSFCEALWLRDQNLVLENTT